jgi:hypothetical protein
MRCPARMKNGMAWSAKESRPVARRWAEVMRAGSSGMLTSMARDVAMPIPKATGTPSARSATREMPRSSKALTESSGWRAFA